MARPRQPINLLLYKGKKNLTKQEIEERKQQEVRAPNNKVKAPAYLEKELKKEFNKISSVLLEIGIMSNLDVDALARFLISRKMYLQVTEEILARSPVKTFMEPVKDDEGKIIGVNEIDVISESYSELLQMQDRLFKQCRQASSDLGLTISSRCKLVIPKKEDKKPSEFDRKFGDL
ncbi:phage terminase small subunit P27 family [Brevibacillus sp. VP]|uniref:phage terminase small subunit P27 family n=1 Tax=unclassified Brevibacillus TaxID=2684853 RepID=UPI000E2F212D|nr:phage terminase small subunit P27 family [Brevibacillus sp. VP]RFB28253.1 phage terminase small subunit P27 family [Brevibacillus sp. VP]